MNNTATESSSDDPFKKYVKYVKWTLMINFLMYFSFHIGELVSKAKYSGEGYYDLCPKGVGYVMELTICVLGISFVTLFYTTTAFMVRPWIGACLKALFSGIFGLFLFFVMADRYIGVHVTEEDCTFVRTWPYMSTTLSRDKIYEVKSSDTGLVSSIDIIDTSDKLLDLRPVYNLDSTGKKRMAELRMILTPPSKQDAAQQRERRPE